MSASLSLSRPASARSGAAVNGATACRSASAHRAPLRAPAPTPRRPLASPPRAAPSSDEGGETFAQKAINALTVALTNSPVNEGKKLLAKAQAGEYDGAAWKARVEAEVAATPVLVYSWSGCPFCKRAKAILEAATADIDGKPAGYYKVLELDTMGTEGKVYRAALSDMTGRTSMPQIFIRGAFVGGCNDGPGVATLEKEGKLKGMLVTAAKA